MKKALTAVVPHIPFLPLWLVPVLIALGVFGFHLVAVVGLMYVVTGGMVSWQVCPASWTSMTALCEAGRYKSARLAFWNAGIIWLLWPWPLAAWLWQRVTGKLPSWAPRL